MTLDKEHIKNLIKHVTDAEMSISKKRYYENEKDIKIWLENNIGEERYGHPIDDALTGWMDYVDGEWAIRKGNILDTDAYDKIYIWFAYSYKKETKHKMLAFKLMWG